MEPAFDEIHTIEDLDVTITKKSTVTEPAFNEIRTVEDLDGGVTEKRTEYEKVRFKIHRTGCKKTYVSKVQHIRS